MIFGRKLTHTALLIIQQPNQITKYYTVNVPTPVVRAFQVYSKGNNGGLKALAPYVRHLIPNDVNTAVSVNPNTFKKAVRATLKTNGAFFHENTVENAPG